MKAEMFLEFDSVDSTLWDRIERFIETRPLYIPEQLPVAQTVRMDEQRLRVSEEKVDV